MQLLHIVAFPRSRVSMLQELLTHSSLCFEFVELTLILSSIYWVQLLHIVAFRRSRVSMLQELLTHSSLCFEFVELTLNTYLESLTQLCSIRDINNISITDIRPGFVRTPLLGENCHYPMQLDVNTVAKHIVKAIEQKRSVATIDWKYRIVVFIWRLIPRYIWTKLKIRS